MTMRLCPRLLATVIATLTLWTAGSTALAGPLTAKTLVSLDRLSDPRVSPDGRFVAYDLRTVDFDANKSHHSIWLIALAAKAAPRRLADPGGDATSPRWSPDGKFIYFLSERSGDGQIWRMAVDGGSATRVTHLPLEVGAFRLSPDARHVVVALAVFPDAEDPAATKARLDAIKTQKTTGVLYDKIFVRHWDTWADGTRNHLFALALDANGEASGPPVPLMAGFDGDAPGKPFGDDADYYGAFESAFGLDIANS